MKIYFRIKGIIFKMIYPHHQKALEYFKSQQQAEPQVLAAIVIGSVARGEAGERSDIDLLVVLDQQTYLERKAAGQMGFYEVYPVDQHNVDLGGAFINLDYLYEVDRRGPEPARFAFKDALVLFSRIPKLIDLVPRLVIYQEHERLEKMTSFASQLPVHFSFMELADLSQNAYLLSETAVEIVLFGGRLILAYNRMLYPNCKLFIREFSRAPEKPDGILQLAETLLRKPGIPTARAFCDTILTFKEWPQPAEGVMSRFVRDRDNFWLNGLATLCES